MTSVWNGTTTLNAQIFKNFPGVRFKQKVSAKKYFGIKDIRDSDDHWVTTTQEPIGINRGHFIVWAQHDEATVAEPLEVEYSLYLEQIYMFRQVNEDMVDQ